ncbi:hypothetical protein GGD57_000847 [Rhizobium esperanzae]|uniref:Uncharacterized protein n=1 Tax=Rhizobium esperanzae TaxID=1967781 RepID=A0A7W6W3D8_9HYPH|nr:hypothetical protein [Rhizobium esperanzae]
MSTAGRASSQPERQTTRVAAPTPAWWAPLSASPKAIGLVNTLTCDARFKDLERVIDIDKKDRP